MLQEQYLARAYVLYSTLRQVLLASCNPEGMYYGRVRHQRAAHTFASIFHVDTA